MTLSELVFTIRGRENVEDHDAALLEDAEQVVPAVLAGGVMMDTVSNDHIDDAIHNLAVKHTEGLDATDASLERVGDAIQNGRVPVAQDVHGVVVHDISGLACNRWTPEVVAAYYLGLAVGHRLAGFRDSYRQMIAVRNVEAQTHWTRYNIQITLNSVVLFGFLFSRQQLHPESAAPVIALGSVLTTVWVVLNRRGHRWLRYWNEKLSDLETSAELAEVFTQAISQTHSLVHVGVLSSFIGLVFSVTWMMLAFYQARHVHSIWSVIAFLLTITMLGVCLWGVGSQVWDAYRQKRVSEKVSDPKRKKESPYG